MTTNNLTQNTLRNRQAQSANRRTATRSCNGNQATETANGNIRLPSCGCINNEELLDCAKRRIFMYLGDYAYNLLDTLTLPANHQNLNRSLLNIACGRELPANHPSLQQLLCMALNGDQPIQPTDCTMPWLCEEPCNRNCHHNCERPLTPRQREGIRLFLGCSVYAALATLSLPADHPSLEGSMLELAYTGELPCGHQTLDELLATALDC